MGADVNFAAKAADIVGPHLNPLENAIALSLGEKPSVQAIGRPVGHVLTSSRKAVQGIKSACKRHGTLNLLAALEVATGQIATRSTTRKRRIEFPEYMRQMAAECDSAQEIHVILDNCRIHNRRGAWLAPIPISCSISPPRPQAGSTWLRFSILGSLPAAELGKLERADGAHGFSFELDYDLRYCEFLAQLLMVTKCP